MGVVDRRVIGLAASLGIAMSLVLYSVSQVHPDTLTTPETNAHSPQHHRKGVDEPSVYRAIVSPHWLRNATQFWYRNDLPGDSREFIFVDAESGTRRLAFDHAAIAQRIGATDALQLPIERLRYSDDGRRVMLVGEQQQWQLDLQTGTLDEQPLDHEPHGLLPVASSSRSVRTGTESEISFDNQTDASVQLYWIDRHGARQPYGQIAGRTRKSQHTYDGHVWLIANEKGETLAVFAAVDNPAVANITAEFRPQPSKSRSGQRRQRTPNPNLSPDEQWIASIKDDNVYLRPVASDGLAFALSDDGSKHHAYRHIHWSPDSKTLIAWRVKPGAQKEVHLIESSPQGGGRARLRSRPYCLPGDEIARYELNLFDVASQRQTKPVVDEFEHEWVRPQIGWLTDQRHFVWSQADRGHQRFRIFQVDVQSGEVQTLVDEKSDTFIWTAHMEMLDLKLVNLLTTTDEIIYVSERDGWRHLYLVDALAGGIKNQITQGDFVVRGIDFIDEEKREIWFHAGGLNPGQDPYFLHYYRINFDGTELVALTEGNGHHQVEFSPDRRFLIDRWSRVDAPPMHALRRVSDGKLVCHLEAADSTELQASGWQTPEVFVAKARDGQTDIWGIVCRPRNFNPAKKYPVIENVYAGPHGAYVPKSFSSRRMFATLTDLGFVVVQLDAMGTAFRSKAFHDLCWKNLKDAGFEDRILWHKAVSAKYPWYDISRVGIYGTSAGGQNAAGAVLFHSEFYDAAVANCGCHDNRMDKASWNEQWMGYPVGPQYAASSNIDNASKLGGKLFLIVGEADTNVPPESTLRFVDSLIRADKDFEMLVCPGENHGTRGPARDYVERRQQEFFVRHLQGTANDE